MSKILIFRPQVGLVNPLEPDKISYLEEEYIDPIQSDQISPQESYTYSSVKTKKRGKISPRRLVVDYLKNIHKNMTGVKLYPNRAGVVIYRIDISETKMMIKVCLGIDNIHHRITNFGGGIRKSETPIEAALRELNEETYNIFSEDAQAISDDSIVAISPENFVLFLPTTMSSHIADELFTSYKKEYESTNMASSEIHALKWYDINDLIVHLSDDSIDLVWSHLHGALLAGCKKIVMEFLS